MGELGEGRAILVLLGVFVLYRVGLQLAGDLGHQELKSPIMGIWLALCIYTWVGPGLFRRSVRKDLEQVKLRD